MSITHCVGLTAVAVIWMSGKPNAGYLATIGPAPLRFNIPARGQDVTVILPPLAMKDPEPEVEFYGPPVPSTPLAPVTAAAPAAMPVIAPPTDPMTTFTPQMLIQFFSGDATNHDYNVVMPVPFSPPPASIPAPPSRATYTKQ